MSRPLAVGAGLNVIILLTGPVEQGPLAARLRSCDPAVVVHPAATLGELLAIDGPVLEQARLVAFATPVIVPPAVLEKLGYRAYNFHPGPPEFPGLSPAQYAVYRGARQFGVTLHEMAAKVDAGPIVMARRFPLPAGISVTVLEQQSYGALAQLFWDFAPALVGSDAPLPHSADAWSGKKTSRRSYETLCAISPDIPRDELDRRISAFGTGQFGLIPTVTLHGHRFRLVPEGEETPGAP